MAELLGRPLAPWQRLVAQVATERDPATGRAAYPKVVLVVPRRAGKTHLLLCMGLAAGLTPGVRSFYMSHRRETAATLWRDEWVPNLERSPLRPHVTLRRSNGSESITLPSTGSTLRLLPPKGDAARSFRSDLAMIDEAREFGLDQGKELEAGIFPTQATGNGGQTWIVSNAGTSESAWLREWVDRGRAAVEDGRQDGIAYFEWSADPEADLDDPAVWASCHPGLGHHVNLDALAGDHLVMTPDDFRTEYLGVWSEVMVDRLLVDAWDATTDGGAAIVGPPVFAVETSIDRTRTVVVAAGLDSDGRTVVELVDDRPGTGWVAERLAQLIARHSPHGITWDSASPAAALEVDDLPARFLPLRTTSVIVAAGRFHDRLLAGQLVHREDPTLTTAISYLRRRAAGGAWLWDRRQPEAIPALAATLAVHALHENRPPQVF